jgi:hypothetical protein
MEGLREIRKDLSQYSRFPGQYLNSRPLDYLTVTVSGILRPSTTSSHKIPINSVICVSKLGCYTILVYVICNYASTYALIEYLYSQFL